MNVAERVYQLLVAGHKDAVIASAVGCDPSYVSQLLAQPEFREKVQAAKMQAALQYKEMDDALDSIEATLINTFKKVAPLITKPNEVLHALTKVNGMKRKSQISSSPDSGSGAGVVQIFLPPAMHERYNITVDANNKVIQIGEATMVPAASAMVERLHQERQAQHGTKELPAPEPRERAKALTAEDF